MIIWEGKEYPDIEPFKVTEPFDFEGQHFETQDQWDTYLQQRRVERHREITYYTICYNKLVHQVGLRASGRAGKESNALYTELLSVGMVAIAKIFNTYEDEKPANLKTYAHTVISNELNMYLRQHRRYNKMQAVDFLEHKLTDHVTPEDLLLEKERQHEMIMQIGDMAHELTDKQIMVMQRRILGGDRLEDVAESLGVSKQAVQQMEQRLIQRLKERINGIRSDSEVS